MANANAPSSAISSPDVAPHPAPSIGSTTTEVEEPGDTAPSGSSQEKVEGGAAPAHVFPVLSTARQCGLVAVVTTAMVVNIMQTQSVVMALDHIGNDLHVESSNLQWLSSAYSLAFGSLLLLFGRLADIHGHKLVFLLGMGWFCIWSIAVGLAPNEISIDIFRALQGAGTGAAIPSALGILGSSFAPSQAKSTAFATFSAGAPIGGSLGAVFGGVLTQYAPDGWRSIFFVSAGIAALIVIAGWFCIPPDPIRSEADRSVDYLGGALVTSGLVLFTFALADGSSAPQGWRTPYVPTLFSIGILLLISFWFWEKHVEFSTPRMPLMRTSLWHKERFAAVQLIAGLGWSAFASFMFFVTIYFQTYEGLEPILVTIRFLPSPFTGIFLNVIVALIAHRVPAQVLLMLGALGTALAPLLYAVQRTGVPYWEFQFPAMILIVFGADFIFATGIMYVSKIAGQGEQALAGGVFNMITQIGTAFGLAIMTVIQTKVTATEVERLGGVYNANSTDIPKAATLKALRAVFWGCTAFAFSALVVAATCCIGIGRVGHHVAKPDAHAIAEKGAGEELEKARKVAVMVLINKALGIVPAKTSASHL